MHQCEDPTPEYTDAQLKLIASQDLKYVNYKRSVEQKVFCVPFIFSVKEKKKTKYILPSEVKEWIPLVLSRVLPLVCVGEGGTPVRSYDIGTPLSPPDQDQVRGIPPDQDQVRSTPPPDQDQDRDTLSPRTGYGTDGTPLTFSRRRTFLFFRESFIRVNLKLSTWLRASQLSL